MFDSALCAALAREWQDSLAGCRLERLVMPEPHRLDLELSSRTARARLTFVLRPGQARCHPTGDGAHGLAAPPAFCQYLRRHLGGKRLEGVEAQPLERSLRLQFAGVDELGDRRRYVLWAELFGPRPNLVLTAEDGRILESFRHRSPEREGDRAVLPGLPYDPPRRSDKVDPRQGGGAAVQAAVSHGATPGQEAAAVLVRRVAGLSPVLARELLARAGFDPACRVAEVAAGMDRLGRSLDLLLPILLGEAPEPTLAVGPDGAPLAVTPLRPVQFGTADGPSPVRLFPLPTVGEALDRFYAAVRDREQVDSLRARLRRLVRSRRERLALKLERQEQELSAGEADLGLRHQAELLLAFQAQIPAGATEAVLEDWLAEGRTVRIPLPDGATPVAEANRLFARYQRAQRRRVALAPQIAQGRDALAYLASLEDAAERATDLETLQLVAAEMRRSRLLDDEAAARAKPPARRSRPAARRGAAGAPPFRPLRYRTRGGVPVWVGRSGWENDRLSLREASPTDLWFHVADGPGAHAVLRPSAGRHVSDQDREDAALIAAYHSAQRRSSHVVVDVCPVGRLRKPPGAPPGFVLYDRVGALSVTPDPERVAALREGVGSGPA